MRGSGTPVGNYRFELDGIDAFGPVSVSGGRDTKSYVGIPEPNRTHQTKVPNVNDVDDLTLRIPVGMYPNAMRQLKQWESDYNRGIVGPKNGHCVVMDKTGTVELETLRYVNCQPIVVDLDDRTARGDDFAAYTVILSVERKEFI